MISVILVQYNRGDLTSACIESLVRYSPQGHEIIVVDNASTDGSGENVRSRFPALTFIKEGVNRGFGAANNAGAGVARGDLLLFLNNDSYVEGDVLTSLEEYMQMHPECAAAGVALRNPDGTIQPSFGEWPTIWSEWRTKRRKGFALPKEAAPVDWLTGAACCVRREIFRKVGGFDEGYFMYFEDVDLCRRIADVGGARHVIPSIGVVHLGGGSQPADLRPAIRATYRRSQIRYYRKHAGALQQALLRCYLWTKGIREARDAPCDGRP